MKIVLNIFGEFFDTNTNCDNISSNTIIQYISYLKSNKNINYVTINSYLRGIRAFIYFCIELGYTEKFKIELLKTEKRIKAIYSDYELELLMKKPNINSCSFCEYRNWVISNYLLGTGNRVSTVCNIKIEDIDFVNSVANLRKTKNRKQQIIPISNSLILILSEYLKYRKGNNDEYLFCNHYGKQFTPAGLEKAISNYSQPPLVLEVQGMISD